jgi:hypothetical protein
VLIHLETDDADLLTIKGRISWALNLVISGLMKISLPVLALEFIPVIRE